MACENLKGTGDMSMTRQNLYIREFTIGDRRLAPRVRAAGAEAG